MLLRSVFVPAQYVVPQKMKKRGRPATGKGRQTGLRLPPELDAAIDEWIAGQGEPKPTKPEAIRCLLRLALDQKGRAPPSGRAEME